MGHNLHLGEKILCSMLVLASLCALTLGAASAKYSVVGEAKDSARAARFCLVTQLSESQIVFENGDVKPVHFTVSNWDGNASEVSIEYDVIVTLDAKLESLGFEAELFCNGEQGGEREKEQMDGEVVYTFFGVGRFEAGETATDSLLLYLSVSAPETSEAFRIQIDVFARQTM